MKLHWIFNRYMRPDDGGEGSGGGGTVDRGDDFTPTGPDADAAADAAAAAEVAAAAAAGADKGDKGDDAAADAADDAADDAAAAEVARAKRVRIPLERHEAVLRAERLRREALENENAALRAAQQAKEASKEIDDAEAAILEKESNYDALVADGKLPEARALRAEIKAAERAVMERRMTAASEAAQARAVEAVRYDAACDAVEAAYPVLDTKHASYDADKSAEVVELQRAYVATGKSRADALRQAVKLILGEPAKAAPTPAPTPKETAQAIIDAAKAKAVARNVAAAASQPPITAKVGIDSDKLGGGSTMTAEQIVKLSQAAFAKLDEATLARARGDEL